MIYERMRGYTYHQIGCTSCGCCRSQPDADDKSKEIFLLSFLALVNLGAVWDSSGWGTLLKLYVLVTLVKEALSSEMRLQWSPTSLEVCKGGLTWPCLVPCRLQSMRLFSTWRFVVACESGKKALLAWERGPLHPELWQSCSWEHFGVKPFLAQCFHSDFICVSIKKVPFKRLFKYPYEEVRTACKGWKFFSLW